MEPDEKYIAVCYFLQEGNDDYKCELTDRRLTVRRKRNTSEFPIQGVKFLQINHRKLLIPVVFGGVFTPLVAVGYFEGFFHPVIAVLFIVAGIFTFYLGWLGQYVLTVNEGQGHVDFPVEDPGENLMAFIDFTNQYIENEPLELRSLFLLIGSEDKSLTIKEIALRDPPFELFTFRQLKERFLSDPGISEAVTWAIDPLRTGSQVRYQRVKDDGRLRPVLSGRIIPEAILRKYTRDEFMAISPENKNY